MAALDARVAKFQQTVGVLGLDAVAEPTEDDEPEEQAVTTDVELEVSGCIEGSPEANDVQGYLNAGLGNVVAAGGVSSHEVNAIIRLAVDNELAATQKYVPGNQAANLGIIRSAWGNEFEKNLGEVQRFVQRTPGLARYLDETGLGDVPSVIFAIHDHVRGVTRISKAEAQRRLDAAMKPGNSYLRGDSAAVRECGR